MKSIAFIDTEVSTEDNKSYDFGAIDNSGKQLHTGVPHEFFSFIENKDFICGHNIVDHDAKHTVIPEKAKLIDTLYLSPLLFPTDLIMHFLKTINCLQTSSIIRLMIHRKLWICFMTRLMHLINLMMN